MFLSFDLYIFGAGVVERMTPDATLIVQGILFLISYYILSKWFFGPVSEVIFERERRVDRALEEFRKMEIEGRELEKKYKEKIAEARREAQQIHNRAREEAAKEEEAILGKAYGEVEQILSSAREKRDRVRDEVSKKLDAEAEVLSELIVRKILKRNAN